MAFFTRQFLTARLLGFVCISAVASIGSGCTILDKYTMVMPVDTYEPVSHMELAFEPFVHFVDDTMHPGKMVPCLKGRVYLIGEDGAKTVTARGKLVAQLFDTTNQYQGVTPNFVTDWSFEPRAMKMMQRTDKIGVGYTVYLPFQEFKPAMKNVTLRVVYVDEKGEAREQQSKLALRIAEEAPNVLVEHRHNVPATQLPRR